MIGRLWIINLQGHGRNSSLPAFSYCVWETEENHGNLLPPSRIPALQADIRTKDLSNTKQESYPIYRGYRIIIFGKLIIAQLVKTFPTIYGSRIYISRQWILSRARWIGSTHFIYLRTVLMLCSHLRRRKEILGCHIVVRFRIRVRFNITVTVVCSDEWN